MVVVVVVVVVVSGLVLVVVVVVAVVFGVVVVVVLQARPQYPLALWGDLGVGHHLQPLGLQGLMDNGGGSGAGFDGDLSREVPHPRVGLASGAGGFRRPEGGALGDGEDDEGLDRVVLRGCFRGGGSCWG